MLGLVPSIHVLNTVSTREDVDGRDEPDHDGEGVASINATMAVPSRAVPV